MAFARLVTYWLTILATCWTLAYMYFCNAEKAFRRFDNKSDMIFIAIENEKILEWATHLIGFMTPLLITASLAFLILTNETLPTWRYSYINTLASRIRTFCSDDAELGVQLYKKNQFGVGYPNFTYIAIWLTFLPATIYFLTFAKINLVYHVDENLIPPGKSLHQFQMECISNTAAWAGTIVLSFFLIPVTRHSVLLVALNWSPIHALRIHIWAGYTSFFFIFMHGLIWVYVWIRWAKGPVYQEFIPSMNCWQGNGDTELPCKKQFYNFTGMVAFSFFLVLWVSSFSWFRRKYYSLFYVLHVTCGSFMMLASIWHFEYIALYLLPSIIYYLVSTMPTLVQAVASYMRSGVKVEQAVVLKDAGDCFELRIRVNQYTKEMLAGNNPSMYLKCCCPSLSLVWHPFTVFRHPDDSDTMRLLIRPVGKFTKLLRERLISSSCPVLLVDGLYRGGDHAEQALQCHDHLTITSGGVAITPVISLIFVILQKLKQSIDEKGDSSYRLKSVTLIWSCREVGLVSYVKQEYLDHMARIAFDIPDFDLTIKLFYTGGKNQNDVAVLNATATTVTTDDSECEYTTDRTTTTDICNSNRSELHCGTNTTTSANKTMKKPSDGQMKHKILPPRHHLYFPDNREGHMMEVARMLPARFSNIVSNVPLFLLVAGGTWLGFHIMFATYDYSPFLPYKEKSEQVWVTILLILFYVLVGMVTECIFYYVRKIGNPCQCEYEDQIDALDTTELNDSASLYYTVYEEYYSRPNDEEYLLDAQRSSSPAIFLCAPVPMAEAVHRAIQKENSSFLRTRYVVYEESFVM